jgi:hypothetical protein
LRPLSGEDDRDAHSCSPPRVEQIRPHRASFGYIDGARACVRV